PSIDYESWRYAIVDVGAAGERVGQPVWNALAVPGSDLRRYIGAGQRLLASGTLYAASPGRPRALGVTAAGRAPLDVAALRVNGRALAPVRQRAEFQVSVWTSEAVFALSGALAQGPNALEVEVTGPAELVALDVREGGSAR